jgi:hypothetical protein
MPPQSILAISNYIFAICYIIVTESYTTSKMMMRTTHTHTAAAAAGHSTHEDRCRRSIFGLYMRRVKLFLSLVYIYSTIIDTVLSTENFIHLDIRQ